MSTRRSVARWLAAGAGFVAASYATYAGLTWWRYGRVTRDPESDDSLLDRFMPVYEIVERHHVHVAAPAAVTFTTASEMNLRRSAVVRAIFRAREIVLGSRPTEVSRPQSFLEEMRSIGWGVLAEISGREIVMGAVTQPWAANVVFHALPPDEFATFNEPGFVKIVWTLRADAVTPNTSIFRTETRALATDAASRARFRRYWAVFSPGIIIIRRMMLEPLKRDAEARARLDS
jgi:hypothetical protein